MTDWFLLCPLQEKEECEGAEPLKQEVACLRLKLSQQEKDLCQALEKVRSSERTKESLEKFVLGQRESSFFSFLSTGLVPEEPEVRCFFWVRHQRLTAVGSQQKNHQTNWFLRVLLKFFCLRRRLQVSKLQTSNL